MTMWANRGWQNLTNVKDRAPRLSYTGRMIKALAPIALAAALAACQSAPPETVSSAPAPIPAFVQGVCGDCHAVEPPFLSPNEDAPGFDAIANSAGLTGESLTAWLVDAHNYPELMEFELSQAEARMVADYMVTLQREDYTPDP